MIASQVNQGTTCGHNPYILADFQEPVFKHNDQGVPSAAQFAKLAVPKPDFDVIRFRSDITPPPPALPGVPLFAVGGGAAPPGGGALGAAQPKAVIGINPPLAVDPAITPVFGMLGPCCVGALAAMGLGGGAAAVMRDRGVVGAAVPLWAAGVAHYVAKAIYLPWPAYAFGVAWLAVNIGRAYWRNRNQRAASAVPASTTAQDGGGGDVKPCCAENGGMDTPLLTLGRIPSAQKSGEPQHGGQ